MIKYKYLWAWDRMMRSDYGWSKRLQGLAEQEKAPIDCIYRDITGKWHRFRDIKTEETKQLVQRLVDDIK